MKGFTEDFALYRRILVFARPYWPHMVGYLMLSLLAIPLTLMKPLPLKIAVDSIIGDVPLPMWLVQWLPLDTTNSAQVLTLFVGSFLVLIVIFSQVQGIAGSILKSYAGEKLVLDFRSHLFRHVQRLSLTYHDDTGVADSAYRIQWDAPAIQNATVNVFVPLLTSITLLISMVCIMFFLDWQITLVAIAAAPPIYLLMHIYRVRLRKRWKQVKRLDSSANSVVQEVLSSVRVVKAFGQEEHEQTRFTDKSGQRVRQQIGVITFQGTFDFAINVIIGCTTALALYIGISHVRAEILTVGELLLITSYMAQMYDPMRSISKQVAGLQSSLVSVERSFDLLDELPEVVESRSAKSLVRAKGEIEFRDVEFSYNEGMPVLTDVSLKIPVGSRVGIQGRTGAGKSTLLSLLPRFYDASKGQILLDGEDIKNYKIADLRSQFGIVLQDTVLFSTTVKENIAYGRPSASEKDIIEAAKLANAHEFISGLTGGYDTLVGERGMKLSGGERQRISLARAFLKDAPIIILDEPTSAMDVKTEGAIIESMERLMRGRTTLMIAHRLSTLEACDIRLVVNHGRLEVMEAEYGV